MHRLDRDTSGLLVVALTPTAYTALVDALGDRRVERRYTALVGRAGGAPRRDRSPIGRSPRQPTAGRRGRRPAGQDRYGCEPGFDRPTDLALLGCDLETGRTHQIRVHLASIGHPVVGDRDYGGVATAIAAADVPARRAPAFDHPVTGQALSFDAALPRTWPPSSPALGDPAS